MRGWGLGGRGREAASFEPDPLFHSCLAREEGLHLFFFFFLIGPRTQTFREASRTGLGQCWRYFWGAKRDFWPPEGGLLGTALVSSEEELKYAEYCSPRTSPPPPATHRSFRVGWTVGAPASFLGWLGGGPRGVDMGP